MATGNLFSAPATAGGLFGTAPQQPATGGLFGTAPQQQQQHHHQGEPENGFFITIPSIGLDNTYFPGYTKDNIAKFKSNFQMCEIWLVSRETPNAVKRLIEISLAYNPLSPLCRFKCIFYVKINYPGGSEEDIMRVARSACGHIDDSAWRDAWSHIPKKGLIPMVYRGFQALECRKDEIRKSAKALKSQIDAYKESIDSAQRKNTFLTNKIVYLRKAQAQLEARLARVIAGVPAPVRRTPDSTGDCDPMLAARLEALRTRIHDHQLYEGRISDLEMRSRNVTARCPSASALVRHVDVSLSKSDLAVLREHLMAQQDGIIKLSEAVARCQANLPPPPSSTH